MVAYLFDTILSAGVRQGQIPARTQGARDWFRKTAKSSSTTATKLLKEAPKSRYTTNVQPGNMYLFAYDAKHKKTLPYFDRYPLIFPLKKAPGGFLGLNMHYLPLKLRAVLMDALYDTASNDRYDEKTKLRLSYDILKGASKFKLFKPTVHMYLRSQFKSRFIEIASSEWDIALFLPVEKFVGASKSQVWADSRRMIA